MMTINVGNYPVKGMKILNYKGEEYVLYSVSELEEHENRIYMANLKDLKPISLCRFNENQSIRDYQLDGEYLYIVFDTKVIIAKFVNEWNGKIRLVKITSAILKFAPEQRRSIPKDVVDVVSSYEEDFESEASIKYEFLDKYTESSVYRSKYGIVLYGLDGKFNGAIFNRRYVISNVAMNERYIVVSCFNKEKHESLIVVYLRGGIELKIPYISLKF